MTTPQATSNPVDGDRGKRRWSRRKTISLAAHGEPLVWLTGGSLVLLLAMIMGLLALIVWQGFSTFWPRPIVQVKTSDGAVYLGEVTRTEPAPAAESESPAGSTYRRLIRTENFELTNTHFNWVRQDEIETETRPEWALVLERLEDSRFYGFPKALTIDGEVVADVPEGVWKAFNTYHPPSRVRWREAQSLRTHEVGAVNRKQEAARLAVRTEELRDPVNEERLRKAKENLRGVDEWTRKEFARIYQQIDELDAENNRYQLVMTTVDGKEASIPLAEIVLGYPANQLTLGEKIGVYRSRWLEFLTENPRQANNAGGVFPAIWGTVAMTLIMSFVVAPFGVLAALYLREYAKPGLIVSSVRIAINNLAGVPSIVFGVFGLGFFCYIIGASIDELFFAEQLPSPTFGTGGLMWASLTLALLTLPVVIVATEEALSAVPGSMREGSYACGASKWQTIRRIVLPRALPGITTGMILAMARGAGEVAPLMLVGAVKMAPHLPVDGVFPYIHAQRSFLHLGFHIYDLGFQSQNSEAAKPMVFTTVLLLIAIILVLNLTALVIRSRLRKRFVSAAF